MKKAVPPPVRRLLRRAHRRWTFRRAMRRFVEDPGCHARPGDTTLRDLVYGWGNEGWSAREEYLAACLAEADRTQGPVLECGSGLSTLLLGVALERQGRALWSLEHEPGWGERVRRALEAWRVGGVRVPVAELRNYGDYDWYDPPLAEMPDRFALVICDGPPAQTRGGRYGLVPVLGSRLGHGAVILLDDADRDLERDTVSRWQSERGARVEEEGVVQPYFRITIGARAR